MILFFPYCWNSVYVGSLNQGLYYSIPIAIQKMVFETYIQALGYSLEFLLSKYTCPEEGFIRPIMFRKVDFPQPEGPTILINSLP